MRTPKQERIAIEIATALDSTPQPDRYWGELRDVYDSLDANLLPADRWHAAYTTMLERQGEFREPGDAPTFDPPARSPQEFTAQYAQAISHMMAIRSNFLYLPENFMGLWRRAQDFK